MLRWPLRCVLTYSHVRSARSSRPPCLRGAATSIWTCLEIVSLLFLFTYRLHFRAGFAGIPRFVGLETAGMNFNSAQLGLVSDFALVFLLFAVGQSHRAPCHHAPTDSSSTLGAFLFRRQVGIR